MSIKELQEKIGAGVVTFYGDCHDCEKRVEVRCCVDENGKLIISGGAVYNPKFGEPPTEHTFFKCDKCFMKDKVLRNWRPVETYSRVVGYIRPVQQWNRGKVEEFNQRKEFVVEGKEKGR